MAESLLTGLVYFSLFVGRNFVFGIGKLKPKKPIFCFKNLGFPALFTTPKV